MHRFLPFLILPLLTACQTLSVGESVIVSSEPVSSSAISMAIPTSSSESLSATSTLSSSSQIPQESLAPFDGCKALGQYSNQDWFPALQKEMLAESFFVNDVSEACVSADYVILIRPMKQEWASKVYRFNLQSSELEEADFENSYAGLFHVDEFGKRTDDYIPLIRVVGKNRCASDTYNVRTNRFTSLHANCGEKLSLCVEDGFGLDNGRMVQPIFPEYKHLPFLGQIFTADDCSSERLSTLFGGLYAKYSIGSHVYLTNDAPDQVREVLPSIGYECGSEACQNWELWNPVHIKDILRLKPYSRYFTGDDCLKCG